MEFLFSTQNLSPRTIRSYRCAIGTAHQGWDGVPVGKDPDLSNMIKAFFLQRPPERKLVPNWSLPLVLNSLCKSPFEPLAKADLKWLSLKTAFLVAIASGRRSSTIQALSVDQGHVRENQSGTTLIPAPGFLAKNESINYMAKAIHFPKMSQFSSVPEDRLLCPCRAIRYYLQRTESIRGSEKHLFVTYGRKAHGAATRDTIANWIVTTIRNAYESSSDFDFNLVSAHDTRSVSTSWALFQGVPLQDILSAASWKGDTTFTAFYMRDVITPQSTFASAVIASARSSSSN